MKTNDKIIAIEEQQKRFENNHGGRSNWWYPYPDTIAINVKMRSFADMDTLREKLTPLQNESMSDEAIQDLFYMEQGAECEILRDEVMEMDGVTNAWFAGRSGGWLEVQFSDADFDVEDPEDAQEVSEVYDAVMVLEKQADAVQELVERAHKAYNDYVDSDGYYTHIMEGIQTDEEIISNKRAELHAMEQLTK